MPIRTVKIQRRFSAGIWRNRQRRLSLLGTDRGFDSRDSKAIIPAIQRVAGFHRVDIERGQRLSHS
jgi:hypothetical protein